MEYFSIEEIAKIRGVSKQAVYKQIAGKTMASRLEGHIIIQEGKQYIDNVGFEILQKSREASPTVYIEAPEKAELDKLKVAYDELKRKYDEKDKALNKITETLSDILKASSENMKLATESRLYIEQKETAEQRCRVLEADREEKVQEIEAIKAENARLKNRGLIERILNR